MASGGGRLWHGDKGERVRLVLALRHQANPLSPRFDSGGVAPLENRTNPPMLEGHPIYLVIG